MLLYCVKNLHIVSVYSFSHQNSQNIVTSLPSPKVKKNYFLLIFSRNQLNHKVANDVKISVGSQFDLQSNHKLENGVNIFILYINYMELNLIFDENYNIDSKKIHVNKKIKMLNLLTQRMFSLRFRVINLNFLFCFPISELILQL